jgi:hypothetical protein
VALGTQQGTSTVEIDIPLGINDGDNVQYPGLAPGGQDLVIEFRIHPHAEFQRHGLNLDCGHTRYRYGHDSRAATLKSNSWRAPFGGKGSPTSLNLEPHLRLTSQGLQRQKRAKRRSHGAYTNPNSQQLHPKLAQPYNITDNIVRMLDQIRIK